jgi:hypothetical protein
LVERRLRGSKARRTFTDPTSLFKSILNKVATTLMANEEGFLQLIQDLNMQIGDFRKVHLDEFMIENSQCEDATGHGAA